MTNHIQPGAVMEYNNSGSAISSGSLVVVGVRVGIAVSDIAATTGKGSLAMEGVFQLPKLSSDNIAQGALVYWDATPGEITTTSSGNTLVGYCFEAAAASTTTIKVKINA